MKKQLGIFLAGVMVLAPLAVTVWVVWWLGATLDGLGREILPNVALPPGVEAAVLIAAVYLVGLATRFWLFQALLSLLEKTMTRLPGVKTLYESVRAYPERFLVLAGHEEVDIERVVEAHGSWVVVEKRPGTPAEVARATDPRT